MCSCRTYREKTHLRQLLIKLYLIYFHSMADAFERCGTYEPNSRKRRQVHLYEAQGQNELEFGRSIERETGDYELKAH